MPAVQETIEQVREIDVDKYKYGFETDIDMEYAPKGLNADIVRFISAKKGEPEWLTDWRLDALKRFETMKRPEWARVDYPEIDLQELYYYAAPKSTEGPKAWTKSIRSFYGLTRSWVFHSKSRKSWQAFASMMSRRSLIAAWTRWPAKSLWTLSLTACLSLRLQKRTRETRHRFLLDI